MSKSTTVMRRLSRSSERSSERQRDKERERDRQREVSPVRGRAGSERDRESGKERERERDSTSRSSQHPRDSHSHSRSRPSTLSGHSRHSNHSQHSHNSDRSREDIDSHHHRHHQHSRDHHKRTSPSPSLSPSPSPIPEIPKAYDDSNPLFPTLQNYLYHLTDLSSTTSSVSLSSLLSAIDNADIIIDDLPPRHIQLLYLQAKQQDQQNQNSARFRYDVSVSNFLHTWFKQCCMERCSRKSSKSPGFVKTKHTPSLLKEFAKSEMMMSNLTSTTIPSEIALDNEFASTSVSTSNQNQQSIIGPSFPTQEELKLLKDMNATESAEQRQSEIAAYDRVREAQLYLKDVQSRLQALKIKHKELKDQNESEPNEKREEWMTALPSAKFGGAIRSFHPRNRHADEKQSDEWTDNPEERPLRIELRFAEKRLRTEEMNLEAVLNAKKAREQQQQPPTNGLENVNPTQESLLAMHKKTIQKEDQSITTADGSPFIWDYATMMNKRIPRRRNSNGDNNSLMNFMTTDSLASRFDPSS